MSTCIRRGRGRANTTKNLMGAMVQIAQSIKPCSVRALAYQLFNRKLIASMSKNDVATVSRLSVIAREEGQLPWEWVVDTTRQEEKVATWDDPEAYARTVQRSYRRNKWTAQPKHISVWSEKATVEGTLRPVPEKYEVPFQVLHGWSGATPVWDAALGNLYRKQETLILYVGDFDPSGLAMSEMDLPRRLARYSSETPTEEISIARAWAEMGYVGLELRRIALTHEHIKQLGKGTRFAAASKSKDTRYEWFARLHGQWCWELDALSPVDLRQCVADAIEAELDREAWDRYARAEEAERQVIMSTCESWRSILQQDQEYCGEAVE